MQAVRGWRELRAQKRADASGINRSGDGVARRGARGGRGLRGMRGRVLLGV